jgi:hypothetical protein
MKELPPTRGDTEKTDYGTAVRGTGGGGVVSQRKNSCCITSIRLDHFRDQIIRISIRPL